MYGSPRRKLYRILEYFNPNGHASRVFPRNPCWKPEKPRPVSISQFPAGDDVGALKTEEMMQ
jgi:hypothetical protein